MAGKPGRSGRRSFKHEYNAKRDKGLTPLQLMLREMRDEKRPMQERLEIAYKAAPYCHARMVDANIEGSQEVVINLVSYLDPKSVIEAVPAQRLESPRNGCSSGSNGVAPEGRQRHD